MNEPLDQFHPTPKPKANPFGKIILGNFAVMLLYMVVGGLIGGRSSDGIDALLLVGQIIVNLFMGLGLLLVKGSRLTGLALLVSGLLIAVIGPGICSYKSSLLQKTEIRPAKPI